MFTRIMVPLDGSALAEAALPTAKEIARALHGEVYLVNIPEDELTVSQRIVGYTWIGASTRMEHIRDERQVYLAEIKQQFSAENVPAHTQLLKGDVATALVDYANTIEADLVVMSTHGRTGITRWALGSIAERVAEGLRRPLLLVRAGTVINQLLVTLDGSFSAERILEPAAQIAKLFNATLTLLYVRDHNTPPYLAHPEEYLSDTAVRLSDEGVSTSTLIREGVAAETIVKTADVISADLICIATHGLHASQWAHGSVTARVIKQCHKALFILPPTA